MSPFFLINLFFLKSVSAYKISYESILFVEEKPLTIAAIKKALDFVDTKDILEAEKALSNDLYIRILRDAKE